MPKAMRACEVTECSSMRQTLESCPALSPAGSQGWATLQGMARAEVRPAHGQKLLGSFFF